MFTAESNRRSRDTRHPRRAWSAVLCALFVFGQLASFVHDALSTHAVCAEHGELVHVDHLADAVAANATPSGQASRATVSIDASRRTQQHEHCSIATLSRERTIQFHAFTPVAVAPACTIAPSSVAVAEDHSSIPLLLLAPKQSPPL